jgi:hypothetical protein
LVVEISAGREASGALSKAIRCNKTARSFGSCRLFLSSGKDQASVFFRWQPASQRGLGSSVAKSFLKSEALWFVKVLKSLSWASRVILGRERHNFTRFALFHSPIFGEGIEYKDGFFDVGLKLRLPHPL